MFAIFLLRFVSLASLTLTTTLFEGPCPEINLVPVMNFTAFTEKPWYQVARYSNDWENAGDCSMLLFEKDDKGTQFFITDVLDGKQMTVNGYIDCDKKALNCAVLEFKSHDFAGSEGEDVLPVHVLAIDYDTYHITYDCKYDAATNKRHGKCLQINYVWVASRTSQLTPEVRAKVDNFLTSTQYINADRLKWGNFTEESCKVSL